jgi:hypothetical protein
MDTVGASYLVSQEIVPETGWRLITLVDKAVIFGKIDEFRRFTNSIGYAAVGLMAAFYAAFFLFLQRKSVRMARRIATPIEGDGVDEHAPGHETATSLEEVGIAEIDHLGKNFHRDGRADWTRPRGTDSNRESSEQHKGIPGRAARMAGHHRQAHGPLQPPEDRHCPAGRDRQGRRSERHFGIMLLDIDHYKLRRSTTPTGTRRGTTS